MSVGIVGVANWSSSFCLTFFFFFQFFLSFFCCLFFVFLLSFFHLSSFLWFFNGLCYIEESRCHSFYGSNSLAAALVIYFLSILSIFLKYPEPTVVKVVRTRVEAGFQRYEYTEATYPPSEIDEASGIHSLASSNSFGRGHTATGAVARTGVSTSGNNWQRSQRDIIV